MQQLLRPGSRHASRARVALSGCCLAGAAAGAGAWVAPAGASSRPSVTVGSLVAAARKAILARSAVHIVSVSRDSATRHLAGSSVIDAGRTASEQRFVAGAAWIRIRFTAGHAYFSGNGDGLTTMLAMPADDRARVGTRWVAIRKGEPAYKGFATAVISSLPTQILPAASAAGSVRLSSGRDAGREVHVLRWSATVGTTKVAISLELAAKGAPLPVAETEVAGTTEQRTAFGRWNERIAVHAPRRTIPYASLSAT